MSGPQQYQTIPCPHCKGAGRVPSNPQGGRQQCETCRGFGLIASKTATEATKPSQDAPKAAPAPQEPTGVLGWLSGLFR